jgi:uncharacterized membrane protein YeaQ/YmgE (transglycosylase-associated protein family)
MRAFRASPDGGNNARGGTMTGILVMIVLGLIIGAVAKLIMPGQDPGGIIVTILLGIAGALVGGFLGRAIGLYQEGQPAGFVMSIIGALVLLFIYRMFTRARA